MDLTMLQNARNAVLGVIKMCAAQQIAKNAYLVQPKTKLVSHHVLIVNLGDS